VSDIVSAAVPNPLIVTVGPSAACEVMAKPASIAVTRVERSGCFIISPRLFIVVLLSIVWACGNDLCILSRAK
jgi:hypothetical protein